jgi:predicted transcriptional regulator
MRGMFEIIGTMLQICCQKTKRTHLIYKANLSSAMLDHYLELALEKGLLEIYQDRSMVITAKGRLYLDEYEKIERILGSSKTKSTFLAPKLKV